MLYSDNTEPSVQELLDDPIAHLLMTRDGLSMVSVWGHIEDARNSLRGRAQRQTSFDAPPDFPK